MEVCCRLCGEVDIKCKMTQSHLVPRSLLKLAGLSKVFLLPTVQRCDPHMGEMAPATFAKLKPEDPGLGAENGVWATYMCCSSCEHSQATLIENALSESKWTVWDGSGNIVAEDVSVDHVLDINCVPSGFSVAPVPDHQHRLYQAAVLFLFREFLGAERWKKETVPAPAETAPEPGPEAEAAPAPAESEPEADHVAADVHAGAEEARRHWFLAFWIPAARGYLLSVLSRGESSRAADLKKRLEKAELQSWMNNETMWGGVLDRESHIHARLDGPNDTKGYGVGMSSDGVGYPMEFTIRFGSVSVVH